MTFDITDGLNRYKPCPKCGATLGMGMSSTKNGVAVWCAVCEFTGPEADRKRELRSIIEMAFDHPEARTIKRL